MTAITAAQPGHRAAILACAASTGVFSPEEVATVDELFGGYLRDPEQSGYHFVVATTADQVAGFACWGPTALSANAADLYWIATHPATQSRGVGAALFHAVEAAARAHQRRLLVIWTSNRADYAPARAFYLRQGCALQTQIADFYADGEDLCVFLKRLN